MKRVLIGVLALAVVAIAGLFGINWYAQNRAAREVETAFDQIRSTGAKADHGKVSFDLRTRTLSIADITAEMASQPPVTVKIGNIVASGLSQPDAGRLAAASIESTGIEIEAQAPAPSTFHVTYKAPKVVLKDYAGPARGERLPAGASPLEIYGLLLKQFAAISMSSMTMPSITGQVDFGSAALGRGEFTYANFVLDGIKEGRIASEKIGDVSFTMDVQQPAPKAQNQKMSGHLVDITCSDIDTTAIAAVLDPKSADDERVHRVYRQASIGPYELTSSLGVQMHMDGISVDEVGMRPSKLQLPALLAMVTAQAAPPSPAQMRDLMEKVAGLYEGLSIRNAEMRGLSITTPEGPLKLASMRADLQDGKANLTVEGLDGKSPQGPIKLGRFALKSFDVAGVMRISGQFADPAHRPPAAQALDLLKALQGAELRDLVAPYKTTSKQVRIDNVSLDWGQFVGPIPTQAHVVAKLNSPLDASNPALLPLLAAGVDSAAIDADLGAGWTESAGTFALSPVKLDIGNILSASASVSLAHVPRDVFTVDPQAAMAQATQIEAGGLELTLRDLGGVDLLVAQFARMQSISRDDARQAILATIKAGGNKFGSDNPDVAGAVEAISRFIETPHQTLTLKLIPRAKVPAMQLVQLIGTDPPSAAAQFKIEASTGL
ncbi:hypothetical protein [Bradyrhizobium sp. STM 3557]|uniref:hypothetical protein n=1 Tax=Bradyrhizobium sp. STM 3557 TaxID=578920 RepID=UPI00388E05D6